MAEETEHCSMHTPARVRVDGRWRRRLPEVEAINMIERLINDAADEVRRRYVPPVADVEKLVVWQLERDDYDPNYVKIAKAAISALYGQK